MYSPLSICVAAVAVEELGYRQHAALQTPAAAVMNLALCGARRLVVGEDGYFFDAVDEDADFDGAAEAFLALAPLNVAELIVHPSVPRGQWRAIVAALHANPSHAFMRRLYLPENLELDEPEAVALLAATRGLAHLRSLRCCGAGADTLLPAVSAGLRRLALPSCAAMGAIAWPQLLALRRLGPVCELDATLTSLDVSGLPQLAHIGDSFAAGCPGLRELRLPASVTSIGKTFLYRCTSFEAVLDLSHTQLRRVSDDFAVQSSVAENYSAL
jgi:hypothetical protein